MKLQSLFLLIIIVPLIGGCSKKIYINSQATQKETIDGDAEEWLGRITLTHKASGLQVAVSNDSENIYLCIQSSKDQINNKMLMGGLEVWIDPTGKGKKTTGIKYPLGRPMSPGNNPQSQQRPDLQSLFDISSGEVELVGFSGSNSGRFSVGNTGDIKLKAQRTANMSIVYEAKIPFRTFFKDKLDQQDGNLEFSYVIIVKGLERPAGFQSGGSGMGAPSGGMGGPPGGGRPGGGGFGGSPSGQMPSGGGSGQTDMFNSVKVQFKAKLSI